MSILQFVQYNLEQFDEVITLQDELLAKYNLHFDIKPDEFAIANLELKRLNDKLSIINRAVADYINGDR